MPELSDLAADRAAAYALTPVSHETSERIDAFMKLLLERQRHVNLVAQSTLPLAFTRHVADSLQLLRLAPERKRWLDLGSGGGFPAIPIACALAGTPGASVNLVESVGKKADFLREAIATLGLPAHVHHARIEDVVPREWPDVVTARALAPLPTLLGYVERFLRKGCVALLMKGQDVEAELTEATKYWTIDHRLVPSATSSSHVLIVRSAAPNRSVASGRPTR